MIITPNADALIKSRISRLNIRFAVRLRIDATWQMLIVFIITPLVEYTRCCCLYAYPSITRSTMLRIAIMLMGTLTVRLSALHLSDAVLAHRPHSLTCNNPHISDCQYHYLLLHWLAMASAMPWYVVDLIFQRPALGPILF